MQEQQDRDLANTYTPNQCYQACAAYLQITTTPYYFNLDSSGQCYCCETCTAIYAPGFTVGSFLQEGENLNCSGCLCCIESLTTY